MSGLCFTTDAPGWKEQILIPLVWGKTPIAISTLNLVQQGSDALIRRNIIQLDDQPKYIRRKSELVDNVARHASQVCRASGANWGSLLGRRALGRCAPFAHQPAFLDTHAVTTSPSWRISSTGRSGEDGEGAFCLRAQDRVQEQLQE